MVTFSLLTLNTFGIPFYLSMGRMKRLAKALNLCSPSVLCLQEIQQNAYLSILKHGLPSYPHQAFFRNRIAPKGGLFCASLPAFPLIMNSFLPYPNQGRLISIGFSDWALNKGVLMFKLDVSGHPCTIMNTHLQANYLADWRPSNSQTKIQLDQVSYLASLAQAEPDDTLVIVCGDFNFPRGTPAYHAMLSQSGLTDALADDPRPTYSPFPLVAASWNTTLDYIFYRTPRGASLPISTDIIPIVNPLSNNPVGRFLTDHHALLINIG